MTSPTSTTFDTIIIGSGYGGLLPAWRLTRAGHRVLLIERGRRALPGDFKQSWDPLYLRDFYDFGFAENLSATYRASRVLGGGSVMNSMMHQRVPREGFDFEDAWPASLTRATFDPYYEELERLLSVRQLSWEQVPRIGGNFARMLHDGGYSADRARMNLGGGCVHCGFCEAGCNFADAKISLVARVLGEAAATGNLQLAEELTVAKIGRDARSRRYQVSAVKTGKSVRSSTFDMTFEAGRVLVAAGPLGTVPLLLRSRDALGGLPETVGTQMSNNGDVNFLLQTPKHYPDHVGYKSTNNAGIITYAFWHEHRVTMHPGFSPIAVMAGVDARFEGKLPWGLEHKHFVKDNAINRLIPVNAMRQISPDLVMSIDGVGAPVIRLVDEDGTRAHGKFMLGLAKKVAEPIGGRVLVTGIRSVLDQGGNHIIGGACMSAEPECGVTDPFGQVWGKPGLFVTDSASIPSSLGINPALTVGANALRIADHLTRSAS